MTELVSLLLLLAHIAILPSLQQGTSRVRYLYFKGDPGDRGRDGPRGPPGTDGRPVSKLQIILKSSITISDWCDAHYDT